MRRTTALNISILCSLVLVAFASCKDNKDEIVISKDVGPGKEKKPKTCIEMAEEIVVTSPLYRKETDGLSEAVEKNGGSSFGIMIEGSPNPEIDGATNYSATYDFNLHESYPDHTTVIDRFTFDPVKQQLYKYEVANDTLIEIDFDRNLLVQFKQLCK